MQACLQICVVCFMVIGRSPLSERMRSIIELKAWLKKRSDNEYASLLANMW